MEKLLDACENNQLEEAKEILTKNPNVNINWTNLQDYTCLHRACYNGHSSIVPLLLAHPDINVNQKDRRGNTPFLWACDRGHTPVVQLMLKDACVLVNEPREYGYTPLSAAAFNGHLEVIEWMIVSGRRDLDLGQAGTNSDALGKAKERKHNSEVASLLERFRVRRTQTTREIRRELGINDFPVAAPPRLTREQYVDFIGWREPPIAVYPPAPIVVAAPAPNPNPPAAGAAPPTPAVTAQQKASFLADLDSRKESYSIPSLLKCHLCSQPDDLIAVRNPKTLSCLHSFCQICLKQQDATVKEQKGNPKCKQCSAPFKTPAGGMQSLECCAFIDSLSKSTQSPAPDLNRIPCGGCEEEATMHCVECNENMGPVCAAAHKKMKALASHTLVSLGDMLDGKIEVQRVPRCQKHPTLEISVNCKTCNEATCSQCLAEKHSGHQFCPLSEIAASSKDDIVSFSVVAAGREKEAEKYLPNFDTAIKKLESQRITAEKEIKATLAILHAALDARGNELIAEMEEVRNATVREKAQVETAVVQLREFRVFNEGLLVQGTPLEIAGTHKDVKARNAALEKMQFPAKPSKEPIIKFQPGNVDQLKQTIASIGTISTSN